MRYFVRLRSLSAYSYTASVRPMLTNMHVLSMHSFSQYEKIDSSEGDFALLLLAGKIGEPTNEQANTQMLLKL